jgi:hypothetical protein
MEHEPSRSHEDATEGTADIFSSDPEHRAIELAFVKRIMETVSPGTDLLGTERNHSDRWSESGVFEDDYARMQSPVFAKIARIAEQFLPERLSFRRFGKPR